MRYWGIRNIHKIDIFRLPRKHLEFLEINKMIAKVKLSEKNWLAESMQISTGKLNSDPSKTTEPENQEMKTLRISVKG